MDPTNSLFNPAALSVPNFANQLGLGQSTIWVMIRKGDLAVIRIGRRTLVPYTELDRILASAGWSK